MRVAKTKGADQLIYGFVFTYAKSRLSHGKNSKLEYLCV